MKVNRIVIVICILLCLMIVVNSHSGRTDANGGHWDRSTGTYHFHSGEYAGRGSSSISSKEYEYEPFIPPYDPPTENPYRSDIIEKNNGDGENSNHSYYNTSDKDNSVAGIIALSAFVLTCFVWPVVDVIKSILEEHFPDNKIQRLESKLNELDKMSYELKGFNEAIVNARKKVIIPHGSLLGDDNLPIDINGNRRTNLYNVYISYNGKKIHRSYGCCNARVVKNIYEIKNRTSDSLCKKCCGGYKIPDLKWVDELILGKRCEKDYDLKLKKYNSAKEEAKKLRADCYTKLSKFILKHSNKNRDKLNTAEIRLESHLKQQFVNPSQTEKR